MYRLCLIEMELGVVCSCMPSLAILVRTVTDRLGTALDKSMRDRHAGTSTSAKDSKRPTGYIDSGATCSRLAPPANVVSGQHPGRPSYGEDSNDSITGSGIKATTTIDQVSEYWQQNSDDNISLRGLVMPSHGFSQGTRVVSGVWADAV